MSDYLINKNFANTKAKIVLITSNKKIAKNPNVDLSICYNHLSEVQTHSVIYPLINDFIVAEYRKIKSKNYTYLLDISDRDSILKFAEQIPLKIKRKKEKSVAR